MSVERFEQQGWRWVCDTQCGQGHRELVFQHPDYPGLLLHEDCCGNCRILTGEVVEVVEKRPRFYNRY